MTDRVQGELTKLRRAELPDDLWDRAQQGSRMASLPPRDPAPRGVGIAAFLVLALVAGIVWTRIGTQSDGAPMAGPSAVEVPARGQVSPVFLTDGRPVFVVHHTDGGVSVVDAISSHHPWGFDDLNVWCPSTRRFVEWAHEAQFDENGTWVDGGPAPYSLVTYGFEPVSLAPNGAPATIEIGAANDPDPAGSAQETDPATYPPLCPGLDEGTTQLLGHSMNEDEIFDTPADAVKAAQTGYVLVRGTLLVDVPGGEPWIQLCDSIVEGACVDGAVVTNIDPLGLYVNVLEPNPVGTGYEEPQVWLTRVRLGTLTGLGIMPPDTLSARPAS